VKRVRGHLSVANVLACVALFAALGGAAYAVTPLGKKSVRTVNLANGAVTALKLRFGAVTTTKLRNGAVTAAKVAPGAIGSNQLADGGVRSIDLGGGVVTGPKLKDGAVSEAKLGNSAVTNSKLAADSVSGGKIQDGAVSPSKLSSTFNAQLVKNVSYASKVSPTGGNFQTVTVECPAGKQVVGGGAKALGAEAVAVTESAPFVAADGRRTGWTASVAKDPADVGVLSVEAYAICAEF
jgi:hypothetical protein